MSFDEVLAEFVTVSRRGPEPRSSWGFGDSAMDAYLPHVDEAHTVHNLETLRRAVERLLRP